MQRTYSEGIVMRRKKEHTALLELGITAKKKKIIYLDEIK
jgi:hypothetical protein